MTDIKFSRRSGLLLAALLLLTASSCMKTPQQKLIGRWYNRGMSIRFEKNGAVLFNSPAGRAVGRYRFAPSRKDVASQESRPNLVMDVVRNHSRVWLNFEVEMLGDDRIRLTSLPEPGATGPRAQPRAWVLKRATEKVKPVVADSTTASRQL